MFCIRLVCGFILSTKDLLKLLDWKNLMSVLIQKYA